MDGVEVNVKSQLGKIIEDLEKIGKAAGGLSAQFKGMSQDVGKEVKQQTQQVQTGLEKMQSFGRRVANQLKQDFMALFSLQSLGAGMKLSNQFSGSIKEAVVLSDTVRRFGSVFGIAQKDFASFQAKMQSGLAEIGLSSEAAANALSGLAETPVRGQGNLTEYAMVAGELASISGQKGQEGNIAKGASGIITARGGNPNDMGQLYSVSNEILQIRKATGKSVTEITAALGEVYSKTNKDFQASLKGGGSTSLAAASLVGGPQATQFIEKFLSMNRIERKGLEAQGFQNILKANGEVNTKALLSTLAEAKARGLGDAQAGLKTYGFSDDEAKGFIRLADALKENEGVINGAHNQIVNLNEEYRRSQGLGDSFRANINKVKGLLSPVISEVTQHLTEGLQDASKTPGGAAAVTGGAAILAALLTGGGLRGAGKGLLGGLGDEAKAKAVEAATGEKVQKVEVINFPSGFGLAGGGAGAAAVGGGLATTVAGAGAAAAVGLAAAEGVKTLASVTSEDVGKTTEDLTGSKSLGDKFENFMRWIEGKGAKQDTRVTIPLPSQSQYVDVKVDLKSKDLKHAALPGRGVSQ